MQTKKLEISVQSIVHLFLLLLLGKYEVHLITLHKRKNIMQH